MTNSHFRNRDPFNIGNPNNFMVDDFDAFFSSIKSPNDYSHNIGQDENVRPEIDDILRFTETESA